jgi:hypothetical protein
MLSGPSLLLAGGRPAESYKRRRPPSTLQEGSNLSIRLQLCWLSPVRRKGDGMPIIHLRELSWHEVEEILARVWCALEAYGLDSPILDMRSSRTGTVDVLLRFDTLPAVIRVIRCLETSLRRQVFRIVSQNVEVHRQRRAIRSRNTRDRRWRKRIAAARAASGEAVPPFRSSPV